jgi:hypothetical protein
MNPSNPTHIHYRLGLRIQMEPLTRRPSGERENAFKLPKFYFRGVKGITRRWLRQHDGCRMRRAGHSFGYSSRWRSTAPITAASATIIKSTAKLYGTTLLVNLLLHSSKQDFQHRRTQSLTEDFIDKDKMEVVILNRSGSVVNEPSEFAPTYSSGVPQDFILANSSDPPASASGAASTAPRAKESWP